MINEILIRPIGVVHSSRIDPSDNHWDRETCWIELDPSIPDEALMGVDAFSHVEILFYFDRVPSHKTAAFARHPRDNMAWPKVGIFALRKSVRPNFIGLSVCAVERVEGNKLYIKGLDAINGTPVLDIKTWVTEFGPRGETRQPAWVTELMTDYWK
jgi:tRNA (adenine37-N6)-methyltransferase